MDFLDQYLRVPKDRVIKGLTSELNILSILKEFNHIKGNAIVLVNTLAEANRIYKAILTYTSLVVLYPMDEITSFLAEAISPELKLTRLETLEKISAKTHYLLVTNLLGFLKKVPAPSQIQGWEIQSNSKINRNQLETKLLEFGYKKESLVTSTGEFAIRGYVVDVFLFQAKRPVRLELSGDDVESIKYFDETTQLTSVSIDRVILKPVTEIIVNQMISLYDYCGCPLVFVYNQTQLQLAFQKIKQEINHLTSSWQNLMLTESHQFKIDSKIIIEELDYYNTPNPIAQKGLNFGGNYALLKRMVIDWQKKGYQVFFCLTNNRQIRQIKAKIGKEVKIINQKINTGFVIGKYVVISESDIEYQMTEIKYKTNYHLGRKIKEYDQLNPGDYVVHAAHGIGVYQGLITLTKNGNQKDYLQINYAQNDKIYIPVEKINNIYKYSGRDGLKPKINRLNSVTWLKTKMAIRKKIHDISAELIKLYANREKIKTTKYKTYEEEVMFAASFPYEATLDQIKAIQEIDHDLRLEKPMDRLLCGDVGFGKTEVAFRAMFKTILNNKQVFYLCPTTILAQQQFKSAQLRFKDYPIEIGLLSRYTTKKEANEIIERLAQGQVDIVVGTHRLLSKDIRFRDLGLLVVDEEQRFGVKHKERLKEYKKDVNVLTLSATPIPRTMKMALSGLRDLSIIDTPPPNRYPVQTYVMAENDHIIKEAITKEMARGGQIFVLFNNIIHSDLVFAKIAKLVPNAKIAIAHGQLSKQELETIMRDFIDKKYDILLCTTIIETGIDIPNANTLIVFNAANFGLSQLYQLRGRVGRSNRIAYAYLLYNPNLILNQTAIKRLNAIKEFTELGSGYRIAMRDLAIRGAGDLLGREQAGFVDAVGISLYLKLIEDEVKRVQGIETSTEAEKGETTSLIEVDTHIGDELTDDPEIKIEIHHKINEISSYESLIKVKKELENRFGHLSHYLLIYMYEEWFEKLARSLNITRVNQTERTIEIEIPEAIKTQLTLVELEAIAVSITPRFKLKSRGRQVIAWLPIKLVSQHFLVYLISFLQQIKVKITS